jgi:predicted amidohydrolase
MGINERDPRYRGRMYNSILYLSPRGGVLGVHRKICITVQERFFHTPGDGGDNLKAIFKTEIGHIGGSICGEHTQLAMIYNWIMQGIQIHCSLWPGSAGLETITDIMTRAVCFAAGAFGVLASTYLPEQDRPKNFYTNSMFNIPEGFRGGSGVINPFGEYIAGPVYDEEAIVYADIDLVDTDRSRDGVNLSGIYSRWDLLNLNVQQETYQPLLPMKTDEGASASLKSARIKDMEEKIKQLEQQLAALAEETPKITDPKE